MYVIGPVSVEADEGEPIPTDGRVFATLKVPLGPTPGQLPELFDAVPDAMVMPSVPSPVMLDTVTVRLEVPLPDTPIVPFAVPVLFRVTSESLSATSVASV